MDITDGPEPIAIIGSGCRLPGSSSSPSKLWELLSKPRDLIRKVDRFNIDSFYKADGNHHGATNVRHSYLLDEDVRLFDPGFFGIKPVEADAIDPLQRLVLETVYESLENGGLPLESLQGSDTAFYVGIMAADFQDLLLRDIENLPTYFGTGTSRSIIANRVSYAFDWHGPSMTIDTACSSSMLALHHAVQTLRRGESSVAVAAGGNLILGPEIYIAESKLNMLSSQGRSAMWDADVDGYGRGEGFVSVVLKRLSDAIRDGDHIDCVIRETRSNQDGRTKGITMPSAAAQARLIADTYAGAGYDLADPRHRPQFFEAHGTGTKAGDPVEAEAIYNAFFGGGADGPGENPLYVGSIKTVVGHTEGTAGLAGVLKTSLGLQAGVVPPNMLFNRLNPALTPYYGPLQITTEPLPWPALPEGVPRRASVNSFGFGGSNAHAILESYTPATPRVNGHSPDGPLIITPFVFSAASESALRRTLSAYRDYLIAHPDVNMADLAWTLRSKRSALAVKAALSASSAEELIAGIDEKLQRADEEPGSYIGVRSVSGQRKILGVFTGQGAQWARMGAQLIEELPLARKLARDMDEALQDLPKLYRPSWSLVDELSRDGTASRLQEAAFSQPICTLVQVILVELLRAAGVHFSAVVGHSSGEIGAAYASGFLSAVDAIKIAHLRGYHSHLAAGPCGEKGAMMAVGTSIEDADDLCSLPDFEGRLMLAASNSSSSVTLSGDEGAVAHAKVVFGDEKKFARLLKVDTAYHSHHMQPCADPYLRSMEEVGIQVQRSSDGTCSWYSSVLYGAKMPADHALRAAYWRDNMTHAVLFTQALTSAVRDANPFHLALEVGPHPALKGPASQTLQEAGFDLPYFGTLKRGQGDLRSISECLAGVWSHLGASAVDLEAVQALVPGGARPRLLKDLPVYQWDHDRPYWYESRKSRLFRSRARPSHELLGVRCDEGAEGEMRWRNFLSVQEVPWIEGHKVQNQTVFPAAGYASMALEAAMAMSGERNVQLLELEDLVLDKAVLFHDEKTPVEVMVTLVNVTADVDGPENEDSGILKADFAVSSHVSRDQDTLTTVATGKVRVTVGPVSEAPKLSPRPPKPPHLVRLDRDKFYDCLESCGYEYTGPFKALSQMERRYNFCTGLVDRPVATSEEAALLVHPALLDPAFQAVLGGYFNPGDGRLWALFLPTRVKKIIVNPTLCRQDDVMREASLPFNAWLSESPAREIRGDVSIFTGGGAEPSVQVEGLSMVALADAAPGDDRPFFAETVWGVAAPDGSLAVRGGRASGYEWELAMACERVAYYYWRRLEETLTPGEREKCEDHHKQLLKAITHSFEQIDAGRVSHVKKEWKDDDERSIAELTNKFATAVDMRLQNSVGRALPAVLRGETTMLEHMLPDNMLDDFYTHGLGFATYNEYLARMISQLAHRYPRMKFIEIGAGTGGATSAVLDSLNSAYLSYTFTDISSGFFEKAAERFSSEGDKITFKALDAEKPPASQGYTPGSYDVVIASNVLHATADLHNTLTNVRSLLKPGGYLFLLEITDNSPLRLGFTMGGLPGWWLGAGDGRPYSPCISAPRWNRALRAAGFSGVDAITPGKDHLPHPFSIMASQAVDERVEQLRRPLFKGQEHGRWGTLYALGGGELGSCHLVEDVVDTVGHRFERVVALESLDDIHDIGFTAHATVVSFLDLDRPVLHEMAQSELKALQTIFENADNLLWVTHGGRDKNPYSNATLGLLRSVSAEIPTLRPQVLDFDAREDPRHHARVIAEVLLRLEATGPWESEPKVKDELLWSTEPELSYKDGRLRVPRILPQTQHNYRLNGLRRVIRNPACRAAEVRLSREEGGWVLREHYGPLVLPSDTQGPTVAVKTRYASTQAHRVGEGAFFFLVAGQRVDSYRWVIALVTERASVVHVPHNAVYELPDGPDAPGMLLSSLISQLVADHILCLASGGELVLVNEPTPQLAAILQREWRAQGLEARFITQDSTRTGKEWIHLAPHQSSRMISSALPRNISTFVDLGPSNNQGLGSLIESVLPSHVEVKRLDAFVEEYAVISSRQALDAPTELLRETLSRAAITAEYNDLLVAHALPLAKLPQYSKSLQPFSVLEWAVGDDAALEVAKIQPEKLFKRDRTYLLVGLTGEVGRSLCQWMARCGAGAVVLSSRNPKIEQAWIDELERAGTRIKVVAMDATDRDAWVRLRAELEADFPPLAGISNGAMVLHDQFFMDMDVAMLNKVLGPKIDASVHLDEVFSDTALDFFVMFSSLASVVGNRGQSNYAAANTFMASLARNRRERGQPGSVIGIGRLSGIGYLERVQEVVVQQLVKYGFMPISEVDLHHLFAQAILAGLPGSGEDPDIITALRPVWQDEEMQVPWYNNPRFSHMVLPPRTERDTGGEKKTVLSVRAQLSAETSIEGACAALEECFAAKLQVILQMLASDFRADAALIELGVDSLVAVEIRSWFLKEASVDVAVLKILGGASTVELCKHAVEQMPGELLPNVGGPTAASAGGDGPTAKQAPTQVNGSSHVNGAHVNGAHVNGSNVNGATSQPKASVAQASVAHTNAVSPAPKKSLLSAEGAAASPAMGGGKVAGHAPNEIGGSHSGTSGHVNGSATDRSGVNTAWGGSQPPVEKTLNIGGLNGATLNTPSRSVSASALSTVSESTPGELTPPSSSESDDNGPVADQVKPVSKSIAPAREPDPISNDARGPPEVQRRVKISASQSRFWFLNLYMEDQTTSNVTFSYRIKGRVRIPDLSKAVKAVAQAHEGLRTCFMADKGSSETGWQGVIDTSKLKLEHHPVANEDEVAAEYKSVRNTVYDLAQGETMRVALLSLSSTSHIIVFGYHHIIMDGVGFQVFLHGLEQAYSGQALAAPELQYTTYAEKQRRWIEGGGLEKSLAYWTDEFADMPPLLPLLPVSKVPSRKAMNKYKSCHVQKRLDSMMVHRIKALCRESRVTPSHFYLSTFRVLLARLGGTDNICIGLADANRNESHAMTAVGLFLNLLPIHLKGSLSVPFQTVLQETRTKVYEAIGHSDVPFDQILKVLGLGRSSAHNPLFQAFFDYRQGAKEKLRFGDLDFEMGDADLGEMAYDMILDVTEGSAGSLVVLRGQEYIYGAYEMQLLLDSYLILLETFSKNVDVQPDKAKLFGDNQVKAASDAGRGPDIAYEWPSTVGHRVQDMCGQYPSSIAVKDGLGTRLSYRDLASRARAICRKLAAGGVKPGDHVAVFQKPTSDWICSMLAILWSGAVYVPLDLRNPLPRLAAIVESAAPASILAHTSTLELASQLGYSSARVFDVDAVAAIGHAGPRVIPVGAEDVAMILFTSGSTGTPKGLVIRHGNLAKHLESYVKAWDIRQEVVLQQSAFSFDLSLAQIFTALTTGGQLVVVPENKRGDSPKVARLVREERVTWTFATPSEYTSWLQFGGMDLRLASSWKLALSGGERLTTELVRLFAKVDNGRVRLLNTYGPAETIISATMTEISFRNWEGRDEIPVPVGLPLPNYRVYVVDDNLTMLPKGYRGEIIIGGPAPVKGYLNNQDLTREQFIKNPFATGEDKAQGWAVAYRTGDMGRFSREGVLLFEGRRDGDTQVKLRGIRVDLLDIEATLVKKSDGVLSDAVVSVRTEASIVVAHVEFSTGRRPTDADGYLKHLVASLPLPAYMQPALAIPLEKAPLNVHGKKDRAAVSRLPIPGRLPSPGQGTSLTALQERLAQTWRDVLPTDFARLFDVTQDTDFFAVGGNSLLLVKLQARVRETFAVSLPLKGLFDASSLREMAARIEACGVAAGEIGWDEETRLDCDGLPAVDRRNPNHLGVKTVVLTGATGYLGSYILRRLLRHPLVGTVHCIAVRTEDGDLVSARLPRSTAVKVVGHAGDLTAPRLGLSEATTQRLASDADVIIHCGARRSFWDSYHQLRAVNFSSTRELVKMAAPRKVPIHFLSSSGVLLLRNASETGKSLSVASCRPQTDGEDGYVASKWASEAYLENAARELGVPVTVHRFAPEADEAAKGSERVVLGGLLACSLNMGVLPDRDNWEGRFDLIHTESLAGRISTSALEDAAVTPGQATRADPKFVHHPSELSLQTSEVFSFLEESVGGKAMRRLPALEWVGEIKKIGFGYLFASHNVSVGDGDDAGSGARLVSRR